MFRKKHIILIIAIVIALILVSFILYKLTAENQSNTTNNGSVIHTEPLKPTYDQALKIYANRIIQFDQNCSANPTSATFKKNGIIMLDNKSNSSKTIGLNDKKYTIKSYDFTLVTLTTDAPLPYTIIIDCETKQNVATINLQQ